MLIMRKRRARRKARQAGAPSRARAELANGSKAPGEMGRILAPKPKPAKLATGPEVVKAPRKPRRKKKKKAKRRG